MSNNALPRASTNDVKKPGFFGVDAEFAEEPLDDATRALVDEYCANNPGGHERLIPLLHAVQRHLGYLPFSAQHYVGEKLGLSAVQVYGVVSFYHFFSTTPRGKYQIKVCMGTACFVRGSQRLLDTLSETLDMQVGGLSEDGLFNLDAVRCIGACSLAPAMMVNDDVYGGLTATKVKNIVKKLRRQEAAAAENDGADSPEEASQ
jgi:NADH:ubiquinone oxidoreductase subunit E